MNQTKIAEQSLWKASVKICWHKKLSISSLLLLPIVVVEGGFLGFSLFSVIVEEQMFLRFPKSSKSCKVSPFFFLSFPRFILRLIVFVERVPEIRWHHLDLGIIWFTKGCDRPTILCRTVTRSSTITRVTRINLSDFYYCGLCVLQIDMIDEAGSRKQEAVCRHNRNHLNKNHDWQNSSYLDKGYGT